MNDFRHSHIGAIPQGNGRTRFRVWAPHAEHIALHIVAAATNAQAQIPPAQSRLLPMESVGDGYYEALVADVQPGALYAYRLNHLVDRPDPASRFQPQGVHGPSQVMHREFGWTDTHWRGLAWEDYVIYETHAGTFTPEGTFLAMIERLDRLAELGVTAVQLMPVAQFPGARNWGYDGVHPYAPQNTYGGPEGLKALVNACHARSLAVILDVVYNHLGPEGNYLQEFGPYFTDRFRTPWGAAVNFDGPQSDAVRDFFIGNALYWIDEFHVDGLRLDATHAIFDRSARPLLARLADVVNECAQRLDRRVVLIAENNANDPRIVRSSRQGGYGLNAQLLDDFQHALHALLTGEQAGYYADFGRVADFAKASSAGFVLTGQYSRYRGCGWGADASDLPADRFVAYAQCHDTVGNRPGGQRLGRLVGFEALKLAAAATILSPSIPLMFMGEEYDEPASFHYFISHLDPALADAVRAGRMRHLADFPWPGEPCDPQSPEAFERSRLTCFDVASGHHGILRSFYRELLRLRKQLPALRQPDRELAEARVFESQRTLVLLRKSSTSRVCLCLNFHDQASTVELPGDAQWQQLLDTADPRWMGPGAAAHSAANVTLSPNSCVLLASIPTR